jgi:hypothetical protein
MPNDLFIELEGRLGGLRPQLLCEHGSASLELLHGLGGPPEKKAEPHHFLVSFLAQCIVVSKAAGVAQRLLISAVGLGHGYESVKDLKVSLAIVILINHNPVVEEPCQEVTPI